jgi:hypothetical protein
VTPDRLLGLIPAGRIAVLRSLLAGEKSLDVLVRVSALPRRDVEDFLAALDGLEGDPGQLLAAYTASRARVRPGDEDRLTRAAESAIAGVPVPLKRLDHVQATPETLVRRVAWLTDTFDLSGRSVLFAGDHDVTSVLLRQVVPDANLTVVDIDERLLAYIDRAAGDRAGDGAVDGGTGNGAAGPGIRCVYADFRFGLPPAVAQTADVIVTDPPYTPEGLGLFLSRSLQALRRDEPDARIVIAYGHSRRRPDLGVAAQREILRQDVAIDAMLPAFSGYDGAQAVGSVSDWYSCQPTARAFRRLDQASRPGSQAHGIYTHGEQSAESSPRETEGLLDLLPRLGLTERELGLVFRAHAPAGNFAVTASLAKLLEDGLHPSVTGRAGEFLVDLRDDPGSWLLRAMLALNAPRAVFVVDTRHDSLEALTAELRSPREQASPWRLPLAKFESVSVSKLGDRDLSAVRCVLAEERAGDPGVKLAGFVARRAHGKLRNVWREGLIAVASRGTVASRDDGRDGRSLTKRAATDLADGAASAAGLLGDLPLRLIDVPAAHFPALVNALGASAARG